MLGAGGRRVRCGSCGHTWKQEPLAAEAAAQAGEQPAAVAPDEAPTKRIRPEGAKPGRSRPPTKAVAKPRRRGGMAIGWLLCLLVVAAVAAGGYFGRMQIVAAVPATEKLYRMAGIPVEPPLGEGLELREVRSARRLIDGQNVVVIEGLVANVSDSPRTVPQLRASVTDGSGAQVEAWVFTANDTSLPPGGVTQFETSTRNAPGEGSLGIDFVASR